MKSTPSPNDGVSGSKRKTVRWLLVAILVAGVALVVGEWIRLADDAGRDARGRQQGSPATGSTAPRALQKFKTVEEGLDIGDANRDSYEVAFDRNRQLDESALTMWLQRVSRMPELSEEQFRDILDRPSYKNIMRTPKDYGGKAIAVDAYAVQVWKWMPNENFTATRWWNIHAGPLWQVDCLNANSQDPREAPIFTIFTFDPTPILGKPKRIGDKGELLYPYQSSSYQPKYRLAGVFYKLYQIRDRDGQMRQFPVLLVWQMDRTDTAGNVTGPGGMLDSPGHTLIIAIVLILAFAFIYLKKKASRAKRGDRPGPEYRPLRGEDMQVQPAAGPSQAPDDEDDQVDPQLKAASEQYRKERGLDHATDDNGPTR